MRANAFIRSSCSRAASVLLISLCAVGMAFMARHPAIANIPTDAPIDGYANENAGEGDHIEGPDFSMPVVGAELFFGQSTPCATRGAVIATFLQDKSEIGGRIFSLADSVGQRLSDIWRARVGAEKIPISGIVTHMFFDRGADEWMADVVELDKTDCAISRTLLPNHALNNVFATLMRHDDKFRADFEASNEISSPTFGPE